MPHHKGTPWGTKKRQQNVVHMEDKSDQLIVKQRWEKQTNHNIDGKSRTSQMGGNSSNWKQKTKRRAPTRIASEVAATKFREDHIQFIKGGVLNGSIKSVIPDSGASLSTGENVEDYEATAQKITEGIPKCLWRSEKSDRIVKYPHKVRKETKQVDIVPSIKND